jgi:hypothetical protein
MLVSRSRPGDYRGDARSDLMTSCGARSVKAGSWPWDPSGSRWAWSGHGFLHGVSDSLSKATRHGFWVRQASRGHLGLRSQAWWWWPTLPSELVGRSNKGGWPRVPLLRRWRLYLRPVLLDLARVGSSRRLHRRT